MFMDKVKQEMDEDDLSLENQEQRDGPSIAFLVNTSLLKTDMKRDLKKGR